MAKISVLRACLVWLVTIFSSTVSKHFKEDTKEEFSLAFTFKDIGKKNTEEASH